MLSRYNDSMLKPFSTFDAFRLLDDLYAPSRGARLSSSYRVSDVENGLELSLDLPGVKSKDLNVQITDRVINVSGKSRGDDFKHSYRLSKEYDPETVTASLEDGVLTLGFSKVKSPPSRTIDVKVK